MDLGDLGDFLEPDHLKFTLRGTAYEVVPCSADVGLRLQAVLMAGSKAPDDADVERVAGMTDVQLYELALGSDVYTKLRKSATLVELARLGIAAFWWQIGDSDIAEGVYRTGDVSGKASKPTTRTSTGAATTTRKRASTSGTSSRTPRKR